jgi:hypothetical protein
MAGVVAGQTVVFADAAGAQPSRIRIGGCVLFPPLFSSFDSLERRNVRSFDLGNLKSFQGQIASLKSSC